MDDRANENGPPREQHGDPGAVNDQGRELSYAAAAEPATPRYEESIAFLRQALPEGPWCLAAIWPEKSEQNEHRMQVMTYLPAEDELAHAFLEQHGSAGYNLYWTLNRVNRKLVTKPSKGDIRYFVRLWVDIDAKKGEDRGDLLARLQGCTPAPSVILDSGGGFWGIWELAEPVEIDGNADELERHNQVLAKRLGGDACHNVERLCRLPGTLNRPSRAKQEKGQQPRVATVVGEPTWQRKHHLRDFPQPDADGKARAAGNRKPAAVDPDKVVRVEKLDDLPVGDLCKRVIAQGCDPDDPGRWKSRSEPLHWICCELVRARIDDAKILGIITDEVWNISESVRDKPDPLAYAVRQVERAHEVADDLACDKDGIPYPTPGNVRMAVAKLGASLEHDEFSDRSLVHGLDGFGPHLDDKAVSRLWLAVEETFRLKVGKDRFWTIVEDMAMQNRRHPVREYLAGLRWDGRPRLDRWLVDYMGAEDSEYARAVGRIVLLAAVRRARDPGCKFDEMPVLEGPQGTRKSLAIATLAVRAEWFSDDLPLNAKSKEFIEATIGKWIVEAGELKGMRRSDVESLKSCLSRQVDRARMAYGRLPIERARQFVMIGTTNSERYLRDNTGNRRFWPVRVGEVRLSELRADRDQLWAEAAAREAQGESIRLDPALWSAAGEQQEQRRIEDPFVQRLEDVLGDRCGVLLAEDVWRLLAVDADRRTQDQNQRVGEAMRELGWQRTRRRVDGLMRYCYARGDGPRLEPKDDGVAEAPDPRPF